MPYLLEKSKQNEQAALKLYSPEKKYAPSVHCAYYSCIQMMIHILINKAGKTEEQINAETRTVSSHKYYIDQIKTLITAIRPNELANFNIIKDLQDFRVMSDYKNKEVTMSHCETAIKIADKVNTLLTKTFNVV